LSSQCRPTVFFHDCARPAVWEISEHCRPMRLGVADLCLRFLAFSMPVCNAQRGQGRDFGVVGGVPVTAFYGTVGSPKSASYIAASCVVTTDNFVMQCTTVAGVGAALAWTVEVGGQASAPSLAMVAYTPPVITSVTVNGGRTMRTWLSASAHIRPLHFVQTLPRIAVMEPAPDSVYPVAHTPPC
jgi:hypothetical protein